VNDTKYHVRYNSLYTLTFSMFSFFMILSAPHTMEGLAGDVSNEFQSKKLQDFNFVAAGDFGCGDSANKTITNMMSKKPELVLALGDLSYQKNADCWFNIISPLESDAKFKITIGEHDLADNPTIYYEYIKHFNLIKPFYSFEYQNVHFLVMTTAKNSRVPYLNDSEQYKFVKQDLEKAHNNDSINWIIVSSFRAFYSTNTTHPGLDKLQDIYHLLFDKYDVDIVLQAHNHNYQRTYPLSYNQIRQSSPIITDNDDNDYSNIKKGQIFFTVGTGGVELYNFTGQAPYVVKQFARHGFLNVDIRDGGSKMIGTFYDNVGGNDIDHFTIQKKIRKD